MKTILVFLLLAFVAYGVVQYIQEQPAVITTSHPTSTVPVTSESTQVADPTPNLKRIPVKNGTTLTHARVKEVHSSGIVFVCDQGLAMISFDRLPQQFTDFYASQALPDPPAPDPSTLTPAPVVTKPTPPPVKQRTSLDDAQAQLAFEQLRTALKTHLQMDQDIMDRFYKQSSYEPSVSQNDFDVTKRDYAVTLAQLSDVEAKGP